jgi:protein-disulfide isomerase
MSLSLLPIFRPSCSILWDRANFFKNVESEHPLNRNRASFLLVALSSGLAACSGAQPPPATPHAGTAADAGALAQAAPASEETAAIPIFADDAKWGARLAPVTIVAFEDFQCPFCARAAETLSKVQAEFGPDKLRVVFKHAPLPFHPNARPAAEAAEGVRALGGDGAFWRFYASAFAEQRDLSPESYAKWAAAAGVDPQAIAKGSPAWTAKVDRDLDVGKKLGVDGTPSFAVNGHFVVGAQPLEAFEKVVKDELAKATALAATGVAPDAVYATLAAVNLKEELAEAQKRQAEEDKPDTNVYKVPLGKSPALGDKNAPVTIVEFSDFQCPYCRAVEETLKSVREKYGKDVRLVWKNNPLPFHPRAEPAAELALEARAQKGDAGFWAAHDALFASQEKLADADLLAIAHDLKLDPAKVKDAIQKHKHAAAIEDDALEGDDFGAQGTPHFFVNGRRLVGAQPLEAFTALVDDELAKGRALAAKGVAPGAMYEAMTKDGLGPAEPEKKAFPPPPADAPTRGAATAKVVVQEFADFQCPYCEHVEPALDELLKSYAGKVKLVWRNMPLPATMHPDAELAAEAALEAQAQKGQAGFWKMHDLLFAHQKDGGLKRAALDGYAAELGLDMAKWAAALEGHTHKAAVEADQATAQAADINGTPSFLVNGYALSGAQPYGRFRQLVERALAEGVKPAAASKK